MFSESENTDYVKVKHFNLERVNVEHLKRKAKEEYESIVKVNIIRYLLHYISGSCELFFATRCDPGVHLTFSVKISSSIF